MLSSGRPRLPTPTWFSPIDLDGDCAIDGSDPGVLLSSWGAPDFDPRCDFNGDGVVDGHDLGILLGERTWQPWSLLGRARTLCRVLLLIDNYDSFTFNLVHAFETLRPELEVRVVRNDAITAREAEALDPDYLVISPGPCTPKESGVSPELIRLFRGRIPILGVCLGHQAIGECHGMTVRRNERVVHGKTWAIHHDGRGIYTGLPNPFTATRYHSLIVDRASVGGDFEVSAWTAEGEVMGLRWKGEDAMSAPLDGVQFHPESFLTTDGPALLANFLAGRRSVTPAV